MLVPCSCCLRLSDLLFLKIVLKEVPAMAFDDRRKHTYKLERRVARRKSQEFWIHGQRLSAIEGNSVKNGEANEKADLNKLKQPIPK